MNSRPRVLCLVALWSLPACQERGVFCREDMEVHTLSLVTVDACTGQTICADRGELRDGSGVLLVEPIKYEHCVWLLASRPPAGDYTVKTTKAGYRDQNTPFSVREDECGFWTTPSVVYATMTPIDGCPQK